MFLIFHIFFMIINWFFINNLLIKYVPHKYASSRAPSNFWKKSFSKVSITKWHRHSETLSRVLASSIGYCPHSNHMNIQIYNMIKFIIEFYKSRESHNTWLNVWTLFGFIVLFNSILPQLENNIFSNQIKSAWAKLPESIWC